MKKLLVLVTALTLFSMFGTIPVGATGWTGCTWSIFYPIETAEHDLHAYGSFSCDTAGTRNLSLELWRDVSAFPDERKAAKTVTFYGSSGGFFIDDFSCSDTRANFAYYGKARLTNPDTGNSSSWVRGETRSLTIHC